MYWGDPTRSKTIMSVCKLISDHSEHLQTNI
uniref:Uncharacterized protein n=1 Tax=Anguilla anguilla TaxID=7936 RepID=A0A0E9TLS6_ANGAN